MSLVHTLIVEGCTDSLMFNYNSLANVDDGSCTAIINGCTDQTATNYNSSANTDDGSCIPSIYGCTDPTATNYNSSANTDDGSCTYPLSIGDYYQGGRIFYLDENGGGLIAAPYDQSSASEWGCLGYYSMPSESAIGTGAQNTIEIVNYNCSPYASGNSIAANICDWLTLGGYDDWFLPSKDELNLMYLNLKLQGMGGFSNSDYWSSTAYGGNNAYKQNFGSGYQVGNYRNGTFRVRAIRAFETETISP